MYKQGKLLSHKHFISQTHTQNKTKNSCHHALLHSSYSAMYFPCGLNVAGKWLSLQQGRLGWHITEYL